MAGPGEVVERPFADAVDAFIGDDFGEEPVLPGITGNVGFDGCYAHGLNVSYFGPGFLAARPICML